MFVLWMIICCFLGLVILFISFLKKIMCFWFSVLWEVRYLNVDLGRDNLFLICFVVVLVSVIFVFFKMNIMLKKYSGFLCVIVLKV